MRAALGIVVSDTLEVKALRDAIKRKRVKEEPAGSEDNSSPKTRDCEAGKSYNLGRVELTK